MEIPRRRFWRWANPTADLTYMAVVGVSLVAAFSLGFSDGAPGHAGPRWSEFFAAAPLVALTTPLMYQVALWLSRRFLAEPAMGAWPRDWPVLIGLVVTSVLTQVLAAGWAADAAGEKIDLLTVGVRAAMTNLLVGAVGIMLWRWARRMGWAKPVWGPDARPPR